MSSLTPVQMIILSVFLLLLGVVFPFLMTIGIVPSSFFLSFLSFGATVSGSFLGMIGIARYVKFKQ